MTRGRESYDGEIGENYIQPASNRKGRAEMPSWRDPDFARNNWRECRRYLRRYFIAALVPALALIWGAGYAKGLLDAAGDCLPVARIERNPK